MDQPLIDCSKVVAKDTNSEKGIAVYANKDIKQGELVEYGLMRRVDTDGNKNPYLFTWSDDRTIWAYASGCATFYNTSKEPNVKMNRFYNEDRFTIIALQDIKKDDELMHTYKSLQWRTCFQELNKTLI
jgi:SET domain-containing protein